MLDYTLLSCPVCHKRFTRQDDIVVCPQCGAPHHRSCFQEKQQCAYASRHGTAAQWKLPVSRDDEDAVICGNCGAANEAGCVVCAKCGHTLESPLPPVSSEQQDMMEEGAFYDDFSPYIGIAPDSRMDGEEVTDIATFIGPRSGYYLARFQFMRNQKTKMSWNWAAALFPAGWLLYRKMYKPFFVVLAIMILLYLPGMWMAVQLFQPLTENPAAWPSIFTGNGLSSDVWTTGMSLGLNISSSLVFVVRAAMAAIANHLYDRHVFKSIGSIKASSPDPLVYRYSLSKKGGTSIFRVIIGAVLLFILSILAMSCYLLFFPPTV